MDWLQRLIALIVAETVKQILQNLPAISVAWREANQSTLADARQPPKETLNEIDSQLAAVGVRRAGAD